MNKKQNTSQIYSFILPNEQNFAPCYNQEISTTLKGTSNVHWEASSQNLLKLNNKNTTTSTKIPKVFNIDSEQIFIQQVKQFIFFTRHFALFYQRHS